MSSTPPVLPIDRKVVRLAYSLVVGIIPMMFDTTMMNIAIGTLVKELHTTVATLQWVTTGYLLALAMTVPLSGWLVERFGGKAIWLGALLLYLVGSLACAMAWNVEALIVFRMVQGVAGGIMLPAMTAILMKKVDKSALGQFGAMLALPAVIGPMVGPVLAGLVLNYLDWHWIFVVNAVPGLVGVCLAWMTMESDRPENRSVPALDLPGFLLLATGMASLLWGLSNVARNDEGALVFTVTSLVAGAILVGFFASRSLRLGDRALVSVMLFSKKTFSVSTGLMFLTGLANYSAMLLLPLLCQRVWGMDALTSALFLIPQGLGTFLTRGAAGKLTDRYGSRWVTIGGVVITLLGTLPFAFQMGQPNLWWFGGVLVVRGMGLGAVNIPLMATAYQELQGREISYGSVLIRIAGQLGGSFGTAITAVVLSHAMSAQAVSGTGLPGAFDQAFLWTLGLTLLALVVGFVQPPKPPKPQNAQ